MTPIDSACEVKTNISTKEAYGVVGWCDGAG